MQNTALILIDFQNDYFSSIKDSAFPLIKTEEASLNALTLLKCFRQKKLNIIHIRHESDVKKGMFFRKGTFGANIHENVRPLDSEIVITKNFPNSFKNTNLKEVLDDLNINSLIIVGAMSHMCIDAGVRAASDYGYSCKVVSDACATRDLTFEGEVVPSKYVHASFMAALGSVYADIIDTKMLLKEFE